MDFDDFVALKCANNGWPGHRCNAYAALLLLFIREDGERDVVPFYATQIIGKHFFSKVECLL